MAVTMDHLVRQARNAFAQFKRPPSVVVHQGNECFDCPWVAAILADSDCESVLSSDELVFDKIPLDCLNADAILHYLPAIVRQASRPDGVRIAETVAWIFGATEWDTELTISEQIKPRLTAEQIETILEILDQLGTRPFSRLASDHLKSAHDYWRRER